VNRPNVSQANRDALEDLGLIANDHTPDIKGYLLQAVTVR
jgi:hypothetical protein